MPLSIVRNDLSRMSADCIVVAANEDLRITGGVGAQVARRAGFDVLQKYCDRIAPVPTGEAAATPAFGFPAHCIVHAVGPVWNGGADGEDILLARTYASALETARKWEATSVAMPLISTGTYGFPVRWAFDIAVRETRRFLEQYPDMDVTIVLWGNDAYAAGTERFPGLRSYIDDEYVGSRREWGFAGPSVSLNTSARASIPRPEEASEYDDQGVPEPCNYDDSEARTVRYDSPCGAMPEPMGSYSMAPCCASPAPQACEPSRPSAAKQRRGGFSLDIHPIQTLQDKLKKLDKPFSRTLLDLIDRSGLTDAQVYKRANMSRQHFSKIRNDDSYRPTKKTILALAVALELPLEETNDLLARAGFALSHAEMFDVIVEYFITNGKYDIFEINEALYAYDQPLLGR